MSQAPGASSTWGATHAWWNVSRSTLRQLLAGFLGAGLVPALVLAGLSAWRAADALERAAARSMQSAAEAARGAAGRGGREAGSAVVASEGGGMSAEEPWIRPRRLAA